MGFTDNYRLFVAWLQRGRLRYLQGVALLGLVQTLAAFALIGLAAMLLGLLPIPAGSVLITAVGLMGLAWVALLLLPVLRAPRLKGFARKVDHAFPDLKDRTINALELGGALNDPRADEARLGYEPAFVHALVEDTRQRVETLPVTKALAPRGFARWGGILAAGLVLFFGMPVLFPNQLGASMRRLLHPGAAALPFGLRVAPGDITVKPGETVAVKVDVRGARKAPRLLVRGDYEAWHEMGLEAPSPAGVARDGWARWGGDLASVQRNMSYKVVADGHVSPVYNIHLSEPLAVLAFEKHVVAPAYSGLPEQNGNSATGELDGLRGSAATITLETSGDVREASLDFAGVTRALEPVDAHHYRARFALTRGGDYTVRLRGTAGDTASAGPFAVNVLADAPPTLQLLAPERSGLLGPDLHLTVAAQAADDYGLSRAELVYQKGEEDARRVPLPFAPGARQADLTLDWDLSPLNLGPGEVVSMWVEVRDNDAVSGPKMARSETRMFRIPSLAEMFKAQEAENQENLENLTQVSQQQKELQQKLEEATRSIQRNEQMSWEKRKELESAVARQKELMDKIYRAGEQISESLDKMDQQNVVRDELARKMEELRDLMKQLDSPELREQMKKLEEALQRANPDDVKRALENMKMTEQDLLKMLENSIQSLKQMQKAAKLNAAAQLAEELARQQKQLADQVEAQDKQAGKNPADKKNADSQDPKADARAKDADSQKNASRDASSKASDSKSDAQKSSQDAQSSQQKREQLAAQQAEVRKQTEQLAKSVDSLKKEVAEQAPQAEQKMDEAQQQMQQNAQPQMSQTEQSLQQSQQSPQQQQQSSQSRSSRSAQKAMESAAMSLRQAQQAMEQNSNQELAERIRQAAHDLVGVSGKQDEVVQSPDAPPTLAQQQQSLLDGTSQVVTDLEKATEKYGPMPAKIERGLGQAITRMKGSRDLFEKGNGYGGKSLSQEAMSNLNSVVLQMLESAQSMCNKGGSGMGKPKPGGAQQQMSGLSQQQQQINRSTEQMMKMGQAKRQQVPGSNGKPGPQGQNGQQSVEQLAAQQDAVRQGMEDLLRQQADRKELLGNLNDVADQMKKVSDNLANNQLDEQTVDMERKILSRMLDAQRSVNRRDRDPQRWSRPGQDIARSSPGALSEALLQKPQRNGLDLLRQRREVVPAPFVQAVEQYFRNLPTRR